MTNYKQTDITGIEYVRCKAVEISNPLEGVKSILFHEEKVRDVGGDATRAPYGLLEERLTPENATESFDLLNPVDNSVVGSMTYQEFYAACYSLYFKKAADRDAG